MAAPDFVVRSPYACFCLFEGFFQCLSQVQKRSCLVSLVYQAAVPTQTLLLLSASSTSRMELGSAKIQGDLMQADELQQEFSAVLLKEMNKTLVMNLWTQNCSPKYRLFSYFNTFSIMKQLILICCLLRTKAFVSSMASSSLPKYLFAVSQSLLFRMKDSCSSLCHRNKS